MVGGVMLCDQVKSLDWAARQAELIDALPTTVVAEALAKIGLLLAP
jgi:mRNA interferase MazF